MALAACLKDHPEFRPVSQNGNDIQACAKTRIFGFIDDLHFQLRAKHNEIAVRSASRLGFWDLGTNRRRLASLRRGLQRVAEGCRGLQRAELIQDA